MTETKTINLPLAIVGMACRLPGADGLAQYWQLISEGKSPIAEVPPDRLNQELYYNPQRGVRGKTYCKLASLLQNREFDRARCPIPDKLAHSVDNTHLLMTGVAADALRHAGLDPFNLPIRNTAIFIGHAQGSSRLGEVIYREYLDEAISLLEQVDGWREMPAADKAKLRQELIQRLRSRLPPEGSGARDLHCNMVAGTIAKAFGLTGPWLALNSACASSLHAMLMGARALQLGRADMVIVGGASDCKSDSLVLFSAAQAMSQRGSSPFDAGADGLIMAEGYVALVMKTLDRAIADGDPIQAVVRGLGVASDGRGKSLWAPRKEGQIKAMRRAYRSGVEMSGLQYLEAHATGTQLGDATELSTLAEVLGPQLLPAGRKIPVTSVKANIGHSLECAGIAGMIKTVLCMQHRAIPRAINVTTLDPEIDWKSAPYYVPLEPAAWEAPTDGGPRRAAVNAFGIGGLNMHVVIDEYTAASHELVHKDQPKPGISSDDRAVAIIGMSCIFPGANGLPKFWETLVAGSDPKSSPTEQRWTQSALAKLAQSQHPVKGGFVTDFEYDWRKHKVPPKQVAEADPLQFMLLEAAERALADAGYDKKPLDREHCGVIVGTEFGGDFGDHLEMGLRLPEMQHVLSELLRQRGIPDERIEAVNASFANVLLRKWPSLVDETGSFTSSTLASRITKTLDLAGGAVSIDSGSTSAMSSLAVGIDMLLAGDNDLIICTAGQRHMDPCAYETLESAGLLAGAKARNVLDAGYDGIVPAEGVGVVVLKRLSDARRDGDRVHAIIRGLGIAHHDSHSEAIKLAMERSLAMAGVDAADITIAELDTDERLSPAGDELRVLAAGHASPNRTLPLTIGSATAQFGHLGGASGMAALIAASLEIENGQTAPLVGLQQPSAALTPWAQTVRTTKEGQNISGQRLASVACWSKGLACHVILEHGTPVPPTAKTVERAKLTQPARSSTPATASSVSRQPTFAARTLSAPAQPIVAEPLTTEWSICRFAGANVEQLLAQTAGTDAAAVWRSGKANSFKISDRFRLAIVAEGPEALARKLALARPQLQNPAARSVLEQQGIFCREVPKTRPRVAFVFPGQGSQYEGMLRDLVRDVPSANVALHEIDATMTRIGYPTFSQLAWTSPSQLGKDVWSTQISMLLADAIVLAALRDRGIAPDLVLGHSYGEFAAIYAAGALDLETAARLTKARCEGIVTFASNGSGMLATDAPQDVIERVSSRISRELYAANYNAPDQTVIGGKREHLNTLATALQAESHQARVLPVPAAFHTPLMAGASRLLEEGLRGAAVQKPQVALFSTVTNALVRDAADIRRNLGSQLTTPVRYCQLIEQLAAEQPTVFVEVGPQQTLTRLNRRIVSDSADTVACDNPKRAGLEPLLCAQALLECLGACGPTKSSLIIPSLSPALKSSTEMGTMDDQIPHFDATERRRTKMRGNSADATTPKTAAPKISTPQIVAPKVNGTVPHGPATNGTNGTYGGHSSGASNGTTPPLVNGRHATPPAATSAPARSSVAPLQTPASQYQNGSTSHHAPTAPQPIKQVPAAPVVAPATQSAKPAYQTPAAAPVAPAPASHAESVSRAAGPAIKELESFLVNFVVEQTGYPPEVVELDADLEADLGIDSIKKAQLFGELQEYFDISTGASNLSLDDFTTLRHVLNFLGGLEQAAAPVAPVQPPPVQAFVAPVPTQPVAVTPAPSVDRAASVTPPASAAPNAAELESFLVNFVVEQTGYPPEVVELDADLEADLGIDSIKKAQLFGELQEYFDIGTTATNLSLDDFTTLRHVLNFLHQSGSASPGGQDFPAATVPSLTEAGPIPIVPIPPDSPCLAPQTESAPAANAAELESFLVNFVVEQTGYPPEVVELDADLEADLGIDSIKKAQLFGELQEYFDIGTATTNLSLDDFTTLRHVLNFLSGAGSSAPAGQTVQANAQQLHAASEPAPAAAITHTPIAPATVSAEVPVADVGQLQSFLINFVVEQTGYPPEVVELDADLEADLGIDSIKKAQLFGELQEYFDIGTTSTNLSLDDFTTLRHVLNFLVGSSGGAQAPAEVASGAAPEAPSVALAETVRLQGTPYEMGWQHGQRFQAEIHRILRHYVECSGDQLNELPGQSKNSNPQEILSADELDELQGMADAAEVPLGNLLAHHFAVQAELGVGAGHLAIIATQNQTGRLVHAVRQPMPLVSVMREALRAEVFARIPTRGISNLVVSFVGTVGLAGGVNAAGIAITASPLHTLRSRKTGAGYSLVIRQILESATNLDEAISVAKSNTGVQPWYACISHGLNDRVASLEFDGERFTVNAAEGRVQSGDLNLGLQTLAAEISVAESDAYAFAMEPAQGEAWLSRQQSASVASVARFAVPDFLSPGQDTTPGLPDQAARIAMPALSAPQVTDRFVLEMRDAPLSGGAATEPTWNGPALILGCGPTTDALRSRLQSAGVQVYELSLARDIDRVVAELEQICAAGPVPHLFITTGRDGAPIDIYDEQAWAERRHATMVLPFFVCQKWLQLAAAGKWADLCTLVAVTAEDGDFGFQRGANAPEGGALAGLLKAIFIEYTIMAAQQKGPRVKVIDAPYSISADALVNDIFRELASGNLDYEVAFREGQRCVPFAVQQEATSSPTATIRSGGTWVVTGGARGITAACALELGRRFGLKLHLVGVTSLPQIDPAWRGLDDAGLQKLKASVMIDARKAGKPAAQAWDRLQKDLEIDRSLQAFAAAGVQVTYHACDVADRAALNVVLDQIRQSDGPIEGILHGAGIDRSCRFDRKQREVVLQTIGAKVDGAANLMALTRRDPIRHFIGFGSISGRLGSYGQTDYCLASDMLCKLIGSYRRQRPWVKAVGFHWHPWDEVGMAARPETKSILQGKSDLQLMPLAEGIAHLIRELAAGAPQGEVLITERRHWDRFAEGLGKLAGQDRDTAAVASQPVNAAPVSSPAVPAAQPIVATNSANGVEFTTYRCVLRNLVSPLPPGTPTQPAFDSPVWILGNNSAATALEQKLTAAGVVVRRLSAQTNLDQTLAEVEHLWAAQPAKYLFLMTGRDDNAGNIFDPAVMHERRQQSMLLPFFVAQRWYKLLNGQPALGKGTIVAAVSLGGDFGFGGKVVTPDGGALDGLLKALHIEDSRRETSLVRAKVIDAPANEPPAALADAILRELAANEPEVEVSWSSNVRRVVRPLPAPSAGRANRSVPRGGVWVVTGGARGITAIAALGLARRHGWKLHLVGKSPAPITDAPWRAYSEAEMKKLKTTLARQAVAEGRSPSEAWDRVMKDVEIFKNLQQFADVGVQATYHSCDISNRDALAAVLDKVRRQDGPIQGIMHGAGLIDPGRFESKRREFVTALISTKFDGAVNLMSLTRQDPLKYFVGFGSISGRFGGNGLSDYAAGNDVMSKAIDWFRAQRPECATGTIHWESWEGSGMATLPRFAFGPKSVMNMKYMTPEEGVERLDQELQAGLPESEVLYTFGDFYPMFYPDEQRPLGEFLPGPLNVAPANSGDQPLPLLRTIQRDAEGCVGEMPLDPLQDAFLVQHRLRGKALFPVVVGLESLAEAAATAGGKRVVGFHNVQMLDGLLFHSDRPVTAHVSAKLSDNGMAECELKCDFRNRAGGLIQKDRPYLRASVELADNPQPPIAHLPAAPGSWTEFSYPEGGMVYHGPAFRGANGTSFDAVGGWGRILSLPMRDLVGESRATDWTVPSCVLDAALYACGIHLWTYGERAISLPRSIERLELGRTPREGEVCVVYVKAHEIKSDSAWYDFTVLGDDRAVLIRASGYRKVILARGGSA
jgi:acyl transferase domain-containing protein/acyl carrier protein/NAD(P)-dependent dehydrogenase (short-subunit alcohol dehydrogenase family)